MKHVLIEYYKPRLEHFFFTLKKIFLKTLIPIYYETLSRDVLQCSVLQFEITREDNEVSMIWFRTPSSINSSMV